MSNYKSKLARYAEAYPKNEITTTPKFAEVWVRQKEGSYIERVSVLPELPLDHPVRCNMEAWNFQLVARIFAESVSSLVYKGFYKKLTEGNVDEKGSIYSNVYGEDFEQGDDDISLLNIFMFKGFNYLPIKDSSGKYVKTTDNKIATAPVGHINSVAFGFMEDKAYTEKMLEYKSCAMPLTIFAKGISKIQLLKTTDGKPRAIDGEKIKTMRVSLSAMLNATQPKVENSSITEKEYNDAEREYEMANTTADSMANSGIDDLPF